MPDYQHASGLDRSEIRDAGLRAITGAATSSVSAFRPLTGCVLVEIIPVFPIPEDSLLVRPDDMAPLPRQKGIVVATPQNGNVGHMRGATVWFEWGAGQILQFAESDKEYCLLKIEQLIMWGYGNLRTMLNENLLVEIIREQDFEKPPEGCLVHIPADKKRYYEEGIVLKVKYGRYLKVHEHIIFEFASGSAITERVSVTQEYKTYRVIHESQVIGVVEPDDEMPC